MYKNLFRWCNSTLSLNVSIEQLAANITIPLQIHVMSEIDNMQFYTGCRQLRSKNLERSLISQPTSGEALSDG